MPQNYVEVTMNSLGTEEQQYTKQWFCLGVEGKLLYKRFYQLCTLSFCVGFFHCL